MRHPPAISTWLCSGLLLLTSAQGKGVETHPPKEVDSASLISVRAVFTSPGLFSGNIKAIRRLGDRASDATLKILDQEQLAEPKNATNYLRLVRLAFEDPRWIMNSEDRRPVLTLILLDYLRSKEVSHADLEREIQLVSKYVKCQTR
jgi:hypothetical protein